MRQCQATVHCSALFIDGEQQRRAIAIKQRQAVADAGAVLGPLLAAD